MRLASAGNVVIPAIIAIKEMGYTLNVDSNSQSIIAEKEGNIFIAEDPITVLGLIKLYEMKGDKWQATDEEIESAGREYDLIK